MDLERKKKKFLERLAEKNGFVHSTCKSLGVGYRRSTVYEWKTKDKVFSKEWDDIQDACGEEVEESFRDNFLTGDNPDPKSQMFYLKCKRGYRDKEHDGNISGEIVFNGVFGNKDKE
jgi:hypothetical protein